VGRSDLRTCLQVRVKCGGAQWPLRCFGGQQGKGSTLPRARAMQTVSACGRRLAECALHVKFTACPVARATGPLGRDATAATTTCAAPTSVAIAGRARRGIALGGRCRSLGGGAARARARRPRHAACGRHAGAACEGGREGRRARVRPTRRWAWADGHGGKERRGGSEGERRESLALPQTTATRRSSPTPTGVQCSYEGALF